MSEHISRTHVRTARDIILTLRDRLYDSTRETMEHPRTIATQHLDYALDELAQALKADDGTAHNN